MVFQSHLSIMWYLVLIGLDYITFVDLGAWLVVDVISCNLLY